MQSVGEQIRALRRDKGLTLRALAQAVGATKSYLSMIENRRVANPPSNELLAALERALGVTDGRLRRAGDWERAPKAVRSEAARLADDAKKGRELARFILKAASARQGGGRNLDNLYRSGALRQMIDQTLGVPDDGGGSQAKPVPMTRVPLINKVAAGYPTGFTDLDYPARVADDYVGCPGVEDPDAFAASVVGESMLPEYREGDIVIFSPAAEVTDGCDCFVRLEPDHETTFKRVFFDEDGALVRLQPLNPKFPAAVYPREQVAGLYRAVWRYARL